MIVIADGGPDWKPGHTDTINFGIDYFNKHNLDDYFAAPGESSLNQMERRMSNLSNEFSGVILPLDHFGTHIDNSNNTVDSELEFKNFEHACEIIDILIVY